MGSLLISTILFLSTPVFTVTSLHQQEFAVEITMNDLVEAGVNEYLERGLDATFRFHFQLCKKSTSWFDNCEREFQQIHKIHFDPVSESYVVAEDLLGDENEPSERRYKNKEEALQDFRRVESLTLRFLNEGRDAEYYATSDRAYLSIRVDGLSREQGRDAIDWFSYLFTFGLLELQSYDSGWKDFALAPLWKGQSG